ncbi:MAG TPA: response regulator [Desulfobulbus sp.]|nr:response regulator [Desulfobulbus sp.]
MDTESQNMPPAVFAEKYKVLFVDDDPINSESFVLSFSEEYDITTAASGEEALEIFKNEPGISVVLSDQRMGGMSGVELLSNIYAINPDTVRIIITGYIDVSDIIDAVNRGHIYQYVLKPWDIVQLRLILEQATQTWDLTRENQKLADALREKNQLLQEANAHLKDSEKRLRSLSGALIHARENEQKRIALELHDELGQALAALKLQIRIIEKARSGQSPEAGDTVLGGLHGLRGFINEIIENVRRLSKNLSPVIIDDLGLDSAIENLIQRFSEVYGIACTFEVKSLSSFFAEDTHLLIYRLLQEALRNSGKHSGANNVEISFQIAPDLITLTVEDDGIGFSEQETAKMPVDQRGIGMTVMAERVKMLNGEMDIHTSPGRGTRVVFTLPRSVDFSCTTHE